VAGIWHGFEMPTASAARKLVKVALDTEGVQHARSDGRIVQLDFGFRFLDGMVYEAMRLGWNGNDTQWDGTFKRIGRSR